jgi:hypothetical protein
MHLQGAAGAPANRRAVELARPFLTASLLLALAPAASAAPPGTGSGGAVAEPPRLGEGGGALAPGRYASPARSEPSAAGGAAAAAAPGEAEAARDEPHRWETEPREPEWAPYPGVAERTVGEAVGDAAELKTVEGAEPGGTGGVPAAERQGAGGSLPWTGLEIAALAAVGLGLLTLGVALRPRRFSRR